MSKPQLSFGFTAVPWCCQIYFRNA